MALHPDRLFPAEDKVRSIARSLYAGVKDAPIVSPHGHTDPAWYATDARLPGSVVAVREAGPLRLPHALFAGRPARDAGRSPRRRRAGRAGSARDLAAFRQSLAPVPRHAHPPLVRTGAGGCVRHRGPSDACQRGCDLRPRRGCPSDAGPAAPRAFRAVRHQGHLDDRRRARRSRPSQGHPRLRLEGPRPPLLPAGRRDRPGIRGLRRQSRGARAP